jgi:hypothetical protein
LDFGLWTSDFGLRTLDFGLWTSDCDPGKLAIAARLRSETTLPIKWIAGELSTPRRS